MRLFLVIFFTIVNSFPPPLTFPPPPPSTFAPPTLSQLQLAGNPIAQQEYRVKVAAYLSSMINKDIVGHMMCGW